MKQRLQELLKELHTELADADAMDEQSRSELLKLAGEIEVTVGDDAADDVPTPEAQLQEAVLEFETEHPRVAGILGQIADTLSKLGI